MRLCSRALAAFALWYRLYFQLLSSHLVCGQSPLFVGISMWAHHRWSLSRVFHLLETSVFRVVSQLGHFLNNRWCRRQNRYILRHLESRLSRRCLLDHIHWHSRFHRLCMTVLRVNMTAWDLHGGLAHCGQMWFGVLMLLGWFDKTASIGKRGSG